MLKRLLDGENYCCNMCVCVCVRNCFLIYDMGNKKPPPHLPFSFSFAPSWYDMIESLPFSRLQAPRIICICVPSNLGILFFRSQHTLPMIPSLNFQRGRLGGGERYFTKTSFYSSSGRMWWAKSNFYKTFFQFPHLLDLIILHRTIL